uniref:Uncharacterized protein n=1 Tax=Ornithorhynchus anatinus TaxID=9258 RepID=A0A6I8P832_ORNAN
PFCLFPPQPSVQGLAPANSPDYYRYQCDLDVSPPALRSGTRSKRLPDTTAVTVRTRDDRPEVTRRPGAARVSDLIPPAVFQRTQGVTSFRDLVHAQEDEEEEEEGQRFYAGGSERSGQQIVGPPRKRSPNELVRTSSAGPRNTGPSAVDRPAKGAGGPTGPRCGGGRGGRGIREARRALRAGGRRPGPRRRPPRWVPPAVRRGRVPPGRRPAGGVGLRGRGGGGNSKQAGQDVSSRR